MSIGPLVDMTTIMRRHIFAKNNRLQSLPNPSTKKLTNYRFGENYIAPTINNTNNNASTRPGKKIGLSDVYVIWDATEHPLAWIRECLERTEIEKTIAGNVYGFNY